MFLIEILVSIFFSYKNAQLAKQKGQNTTLWVFISIIAFILLYVIVQVVLLLFMMDGLPENPGQVQNFIVDHPFLGITSMFGGVGGFLLIRFILERMPDAESKD